MTHQSTPTQDERPTQDATSRPPAISQSLAQAALPEELERLVRRVVRRTRLRRRERRRVAHQLATDFRTRLDAGADARGLVGEFGPPRRVARQLRRRERRKRRAVDRLAVGTLKWSAAAILLAAGLYGLAVLRFAFASPKPGFDPLERVLALTPSTPDGPAAWPFYREAMTWHRAARRAADPTEVGLALRTPALDPEDATPDEITALADAQAADRAEIGRRQAEIAQLRAAAAMPRLGWEPARRMTAEDMAWFGPTTGRDSPPELIPGVLMPHLDELRQAAKVLVADARMAREAGDGERLADDLLAIIGTARHAREVPSLLGQIIAWAHLDLAAGEAIDVLDSSPAMLADADLARLATALSAAAAWPSLDLAIERILIEDAVQRVYSDDGNGDGRLLLHTTGRRFRLMRISPTGGTYPLVDELAGFIATPAVAWATAGRADTLAVADRLFDRLEDDASVPLLERPRRTFLDVAGDLGFDRPRTQLPLLEILVGIPESISRRIPETQDRVEAAAVAIAAERWRRERGAWPGRLEDLVPTHLPVVPSDAHDGQPLRYESADDGPRLWSVGADGIDGGGAALVHPRTGAVIPTSAFPTDVILLGTPRAVNPMPADR